MIWRYNLVNERKWKPLNSARSGSIPTRNANEALNLPRSGSTLKPRGATSLSRGAPWVIHQIEPVTLKALNRLNPKHTAHQSPPHTSCTIDETHPENSPSDDAPPDPQCIA